MLEFPGRLAMALVALIALAGCNSAGELAPSSEASSFAQVTPSQPAATSGGPRQLVALAEQPVRPGRGDYRIMPEDVLEVVVYQVNDFNRSAQVDSAGNISLPLLGAVPAAGKTSREVEAEIANRLRAKFLQNPQVSVTVKDGLGLRITVEGAVKKPGVVMARGDMTLLRILAESQGFTDLADQSGVMVFRNTAKGRAVARFDANAIRNGRAEDPPIFGGDTVIVDESGMKSAWKGIRESLGFVGIFALLL